MSESVALPALGESVTEGTVTRWLKNVGDHVDIDEPLLEVSTDKVDTEIPSPVAGIVEAILVHEDETVDVGTPLVTIGTGAAAPQAPAPTVPEAAAPEAQTPLAPAPVTPTPVAPPAAPVQQAPETAVFAAAPAAQAPVTPAPTAPAQAPAAIVSPAESTTGTHAASTGYVTPIVRKLAHEQGVDLANVTGSGIGGRIRKEDVLQAAVPKSVAPIQSAPEVHPLAVSPLRGTVQPMSRLRKVVAERAVASMQNTAQLTTVVEVDVTAVAALRDRVKADFLTKTGVKLSFLPFFALAAAEALKAYPVINATVDDTTIVYPDHENISIAVDTERGLLTPVIRNAGDRNIAGFATEIADLAERTRDNRLQPDELAGGTFTLTNTGSRGALFDTPVVFLPQVAILGTGIVTKKPMVLSANGTDSIAIRSTVYLALSYDHRIVDGADAARFLVAVKNRLEAGNFENDLGL